VKFPGKVGNGPMNKIFKFGGDPDHRMDTGVVFRIRHDWEMRKVVNGRSFILIRQMAELVRRALAVVCTVPVLLVLCRSVFHVSVRIKLVHPPSYILRIGAVRALVWVDME